MPTHLIDELVEILKKDRAQAKETLETIEEALKKLHIYMHGKNAGHARSVWTEPHALSGHEHTTNSMSS